MGEQVWEAVHPDPRSRVEAQWAHMGRLSQGRPHCARSLGKEKCLDGKWRERGMGRKVGDGKLGPIHSRGEEAGE